MTTIAVKDGNMASDRLAYLGRGQPAHGRKRKTHHLGEGRVVGISTSDVGAAELLLEWVKGGADLTARVDPWPSDYDVLIVEADGTFTLYVDGAVTAQRFEAPFHAVGSGAAYALGAMAAGASALEAVRIAAEFDPFTKIDLGTDVEWCSKRNEA